MNFRIILRFLDRTSVEIRENIEKDRKVRIFRWKLGKMAENIRKTLNDKAFSEIDYMR
jgi:hypothetical protein